MSAFIIPTKNSASVFENKVSLISSASSSWIFWSSNYNIANGAAFTAIRYYIKCRYYLHGYKWVCFRLESNRNQSSIQQLWHNYCCHCCSAHYALRSKQLGWSFHLLNGFQILANCLAVTWFQTALKWTKYHPSDAKMILLLEKKSQKLSSGWGLCFQTPLAYNGWVLRPQSYRLWYRYFKYVAVCSTRLTLERYIFRYR